MSFFFKIKTVGVQQIFQSYILPKNAFWNSYQVALVGNFHTSWKCQFNYFKVTFDFKLMLGKTACICHLGPM